MSNPAEKAKKALSIPVKITLKRPSMKKYMPKNTEKYGQKPLHNYQKTH